MKKRFHAILTAALALLMLLSIPAHMTSCALKVKAEELSAGFTRAATEEGEITMQTMDFFDTVGYYSAYYMSDKGAFNTLYVGIRDGQLYLSGLNYPAAFHSEKTNTDGTVSKVVFDGYIDDMEPYVTVTLTEKVTGISYTFNVRTVGTVNNVNLDYSEIIF